MLFFEWSSPCVSTCPPVLQASNFTTTSPQLSRTRTRVREHGEYIVPEKERKRESEGGGEREREKSVARADGAHCARTRVPRVRATSLHVKAENTTRYKNKILNRRQLRSDPWEMEKRRRNLSRSGVSLPPFRNLQVECRLGSKLFWMNDMRNEWSVAKCFNISQANSNISS